MAAGFVIVALVAVVLAIIAAKVGWLTTSDRAEATWRLYLEKWYHDKHYIGQPLPFDSATGKPDDLQHMAMQGWGQARREVDGWKSLSRHDQELHAKQYAVKYLFTQVWGSVAAGREAITPGIPSDYAAIWPMWMAALDHAIGQQR